MFNSLNLTRRQKILLGAGLAYMISPIDLVPGFIPVLGQLDDLIITLTVLVKILKELSSEDRKSYLDKFELTLETIEADLQWAKRAAYDITGRAFNSAGRAFNSGSKMTYKLAAWGASAAAKGAANFVMSRKK
ncbi:MAG: DUF1232 domain-containing protein [Firmicutes bacterium]|nr:DUF1232 domain-containing protein [Bacillota bacterium]